MPGVCWDAPKMKRSSIRHVDKGELFVGSWTQKWPILQPRSLSGFPLVFSQVEDVLEQKSNPWRDMRFG